MDDVKDWGIAALEAAAAGLTCKTAVHICYGYGIEANVKWKETLGARMAPVRGDLPGAQQEPHRAGVARMPGLEGADLADPASRRTRRSWSAPSMSRRDRSRRRRPWPRCCAQALAARRSRAASRPAPTAAGAAAARRCRRQARSPRRGRPAPARWCVSVERNRCEHPTEHKPNLLANQARARQVRDTTNSPLISAGSASSSVGQRRHRCLPRAEFGWSDTG